MAQKEAMKMRWWVKVIALMSVISAFMFVMGGIATAFTDLQPAMALLNTALLWLWISVMVSPFWAAVFVLGIVAQRQIVKLVEAREARLKE